MDDLLSSENKISMGPHDCHNCRKKFKFASSLIAHRVIHTGERPHCCNECGCCFSFRQSLDRHRHTHKMGRKYNCVICGDTFHSISARTAHKQTHMEDGVYTCHQCSKKFKWELTLARHLKTHTEDHNANNPTEGHKEGQEVLGEESFSEPPVAFAQPYKQVLADDSGDSPDNAERQIGECPTSQPDTIVPELDKKEISLVKVRTSGRKRKPTMKIQVINLEKEEKVHTCNCGKSFAYRAALTAHQRTHQKERPHICRPYLCSDCGKGFFSHAELLKHERFHTGHKPFQCPHCGKKFTQSCYLTIHLRYHTGVRPYACTECDKSFLSANRLKRHQRTHSGEKPYLCVECGKGFRQSYNLKMHQRTHINILKNVMGLHIKLGH
uniref:C2H2-type domain-containing protein n=1 Tax=Mola mola TaxID=94237 RepID=A0A3Q3WUT4_MOLML